MHHTTAVLASIAALWFAAVVAPGPNFLTATRAAVAGNRAAALQTVFGLAAGAAIWDLAGFFGVHALFAAAPWLYLALKLCGAAYLIFLGIKLFLGSFAPRRDPLAMPSQRSAASAFGAGLLTSIANPRTAVSIASLFAAALPAHPSLSLGLISVAMMVAIALAWYGFVVLVLTTYPAAAAFARFRHWIDRIAGVFFMVFGLRLAWQR